MPDKSNGRVSIALPVPSRPAPSNIMTERYSDGLPFDRVRIAHAILKCYQRMAVEIIHIGMYLCWAQIEMQVEFGDWLASFFPASPSTARKYMLIARRVQESDDPTAMQHFLEIAADKTQSKMLALLDVSDDEVHEACESGEIFGRPLDEIGTMSYRQLREEMKRRDEELARSRDAVRHQTERRRELEEDIVRLRHEALGIMEDEPSELEKRVTRLSMAFGEFIVYLEDMPMVERIERAHAVLGPIQAQYDRLVTTLGVGIPQREERETC